MANKIRFTLRDGKKFVTFNADDQRKLLTLIQSQEEGYRFQDRREIEGYLLRNEWPKSATPQVPATLPTPGPTNIIPLVAMVAGSNIPVAAHA